ncbi:MAG: type I-B CRISPR-associated protein Cas5b [Sulfolobales archaeon]
MKCLRFELFTHTGIFKTPFSIKGIETYPLPPYSTIIGLLYTALGRKWQGETFDISIQGSHEAIFRDYVRFRKYNFKDKALETLPLEVPILYNLRLIIHLRGDEDLLGEFERALKRPYVYLYLSGGEYPVKVLGAKFVELEKMRIDFIELDRSAYVPVDLHRKLIVSPSGILYLMPAFLKKGPNREHHWTQVYYLQKGTVVEEGIVFVDKEGGFPVWLSSFT